MKTKMDRFNGGKPAFTLIELLVVMGIIGILAALLLPVLPAAIARAKRLNCLNNVRQNSLAMISFAVDNRDALPVLNDGNWPWDLPGTAENALIPAGLTRNIQYDPGFPQQNIDQMWNFSIVYASGAGADTNQAIAGYRATGYAWCLSGAARVVLDDQNSSLATQVIPLNGSDPSLVATVPAQPGNLLRVDPSRRTLVADALTTGLNQTDPTAWQSYNWGLHSESGFPNQPSWQSTPYGPWKGSASPHLNNQQLPRGGNQGMLDGHAKWYPFKSQNVHTSGNDKGDPFWWVSDPAIL